MIIILPSRLMPSFLIFTLVISGLCIGVGKTAIPGTVILGVLFLTKALEPSLSVSLTLLLYLVGDSMAVGIYRKNIPWRIILPFLPGFFLGIMLAALLESQINQRLYSIILGTLLTLLAVQQIFASASKKTKKNITHFSVYKTQFFALFCGISSMLGNVGGPFFFLYLLPKKLDNRQTMTAVAWTFMIANLSKITVRIFYLKTISINFPWNYLLISIPTLLIGSLLGKLIISRLNNKLFSSLIYILVLWSGVSLVYQNL